MTGGVIALKSVSVGNFRGMQNHDYVSDMRPREDDLSADSGYEFVTVT